MEPIGKLEGPGGLRRSGAAGVVRDGGRRLEADQRDRLRGRWTSGVQRVRAVRKNQCDVHLRTQVDKVPRLLACRVPDEATGRIDRDRRKKSHTGRNVAK